MAFAEISQRETAKIGGADADGGRFDYGFHGLPPKFSLM